MGHSRASVGLKRLVLLGLFGVFIGQLVRATSKFFDGLLGTLIEYNSSISEVEAPSVSVCPIEKKWLSGAKPTGTLVEQYKNISQRNIIKTLYFAPTPDLTNSKQFNLSDEIDLVQLNLSRRTIFRETYLPIYGWLQKCVIFEPYRSVTPSIMGHIVMELPFNIEKYTTIMVTLHEKHQWNMVPVKYLGASVFGVNVAPGHATSYEVNLKKRYLQDRSEMSCNTLNIERLDECLMYYFDKNMNCKLPWRDENDFNRGKVVCNKLEDSATYATIAWNVTMGSKNLEELLKISGCKRNCHMTEYTVKDMGSTKGLYGNQNTSSYIVLTMPQREILIETQMFTYDFADFVSDFGGFLGLLLGINFIDIYNFFTDFVWGEMGLDDSCVY